MNTRMTCHLTVITLLVAVFLPAVSAQTKREYEVNETLRRGDRTYVAATGAELNGVLNIRLSDGRLRRSVCVVGGVATGETRVFNSAGKYIAIEIWKEGKQNGYAGYFDDNGRMIQEWEFKAGLKYGWFRDWYPDGKPHKAGRYENDRKVGRWVVYAADGTIVETLLFKDGILSSEILNYGDVKDLWKYRSEEIQEILRTELKKAASASWNGAEDAPDSDIGSSRQLPKAPEGAEVPEGIGK